MARNAVDPCGKTPTMNLLRVSRFRFFARRGTLLFAHSHRLRRAMTAIARLRIISGCLVALLALLVAAESPVPASSYTSDTFHESLHLRPLPSGRIHSIFNFRLSSESQSSSYELLPASFIALLETQPVPLRELHLSFNKGRWDYETWGRPVVKDRHGVTWGSEMVGNGAEIWARYNAPASLQQQQRSHRPTHRQADVFHSLLASLSGQFCSTLSATGSREGISMPSNLTSALYGRDASDPSSLVMHLTQPPSPCTETLYPMLALLPCKTAAGLATLLEPHHWLSTEWHGIELSVNRHQQGGWTINIVAASVYDPVRKHGSRDFTISQIFGKALETQCPLASQSFVGLLAPSDARPERVLPIPVDFASDTESEDDDTDADAQTDAALVEARSQSLVSHLVQSGEIVHDWAISPASPSPLDVSVQWAQGEDVNHLKYPSSPQSDLSVERSYISASQLSGHIVLRMTNSRPDTARRLVYREIIPWFVDVNLPSASSATTSLAPLSEADADASSSYIQFTSDLTASPVKQLSFTPSVPRSNPSTIEVEFRIPPRTQVEWKVAFDKDTIRYEEHPPDAHRGLEVGVGTVWEVRRLDGGYDDDDDGEGDDTLPRRYSVLSTYKLAPSLVEVIVPDFSMPYNVIIFTCTLLALFAGSTLNVLTRRFRDVSLPHITQQSQKHDTPADMRRALDLWIAAKHKRR